MGILTRNDIQRIKSLQRKIHRKRTGCFVVEGEKCVAELLASEFEVTELYATNDWSTNFNKISIKYISSPDLKRISTLKSPNKVLAVAKVNTKKKIQKSGLTIVLDDISNPGNLGTILRLADWFSIKKVICSVNTVDIYSSKVIQSSMGSVFRVDVSYLNLQTYLGKIKEPIYGAFAKGNDVKNCNLHIDAHLILGNESRGISQELIPFINEKIAIQRKRDDVESLNVAVATGILLYQFTY